MIVLLNHDCDERTLRELVESIRGMGLEAVTLDEAKGRALEVMGADRGKVLRLRNAPGVAQILTRRTPVGTSEPLWPHGAVQFGILLLLILVGLLALTAIVPPGLGDLAEIGNHPPHPVHEWYLRPLDRFLGIFGGARWLGGVVVLLLWLGLLLWPFVERVPPGTEHETRFIFGLRVLGVGLILLTILLTVGPA